MGIIKNLFRVPKEDEDDRPAPGQPGELKPKTYKLQTMVSVTVESHPVETFSERVHEAFSKQLDRIKEIATSAMYTPTAAGVVVHPGHLTKTERKN